MKFKEFISSTINKFKEAEFFLAKTIENYHNPNEFQYNLNAFIQAFRNITFMLQSEKNKPTNFDTWYSGKQEEMRNHNILRKLVNARNIVVKQSSLSHRSKVQVGLFRGRKMKLVYIHEIDPMTDTKEILEMGKKHFIGFMLDEGHSAIEEQVGVKRTWVVEELGEEEIVSICFTAIKYMRGLICEALELFGVKVVYDDVNLNMSKIQVLLETDLDPSLRKKWDWD